MPLNVKNDISELVGVIIALIVMFWLFLFNFSISLLLTFTLLSYIIGYMVTRLIFKL